MRSKLFVPASRPELFTKALASTADAISFDLEDAVLPDRKAYAREQLGLLLDEPAAARSDKTLIVRINAMDTSHFVDDLRVACRAGIDIINIPKIESRDDLLAGIAQLEQIESDVRAAGHAPVKVLANIESPAALLNAAQIAGAHERVWGLQLGLGDLFEPLDIARYDAPNVHAVMFALRMAAAASGRVVLDSAYADVANAQGFREEALLARRVGFLGKTCIHPSQVALANDVFSPTEQELAWARKIIDAEARNGGNGAYLLDGKMIDAPFVQRARLIVARAGQQAAGH